MFYMLFEHSYIIHIKELCTMEFSIIDIFRQSFKHIYIGVKKIKILINIKVKGFIHLLIFMQ